MKVRNMTSNRTGREVANQFIIEDKGQGFNGNFVKREVFQSYDSVIAIKTQWDDGVRIELDKDNWDCSKTTGKYRNQFLGETRKETETKIKAGIYQLTNLN